MKRRVPTLSEIISRNPPNLEPFKHNQINDPFLGFFSKNRILGAYIDPVYAQPFHRFRQERSLSIGHVSGLLTLFVVLGLTGEVEDDPDIRPRIEEWDACEEQDNPQIP